tara:strand:+ start:149 stop:277 length:129 start_codon:yes stop_codon:yes gene_type:complete
VKFLEDELTDIKLVAKNNNENVGGNGSGEEERGKGARVAPSK